jgi:putative transposase
VVFGRVRYKLRLRDLAELFLQRGIVFTHDTIRDWEEKLAPSLIDTLRTKRHGAVRNSWSVDETSVCVQGQWRYRYRAIDRAGHVVAVRLSDTRDLTAAEAFFRSAWTVTGVMPDRIITNGHDTYPRAIRHVVGDRVTHRTHRSLNNYTRTGPSGHQTTLSVHVWPQNLRHGCALLPPLR